MPSESLIALFTPPCPGRSRPWASSCCWSMSCIWRGSTGSAPERTYRGRSDRLRLVWVEVVRADRDALLAIQTLRNWMTGATLFASTAIPMVRAPWAWPWTARARSGHVPGYASCADPAELFRSVAAGVGLLLHRIPGLRAVAAVRQPCCVPDPAAAERLGTQGGQGAAEGIADTLNRAGGHYNRGTRVFLLVLPFLLWLIGPDWFLGGVLVTLSAALSLRLPHSRVWPGSRRPRPQAATSRWATPTPFLAEDVLICPGQPSRGPDRRRGRPAPGRGRSQPSPRSAQGRAPEALLQALPRCPHLCPPGCRGGDRGHGLLGGHLGHPRGGSDQRHHRLPPGG